MGSTGMQLAGRVQFGQNDSVQFGQIDSHEGSRFVETFW